MSEHEDARYRSSRWPESAGETYSDRESAEEEFSGVTQAAPVDPKSTLGYRLALGAVIGFGVLIVIGIGILIVGLFKGWGHHAEPAAATKAAAAAPAGKKPVSLELAPGYRILSSDTQPGRLILHVRSDTSDQIWIIDTNDGHIVAVVHGQPPR